MVKVKKINGEKNMEVAEMKKALRTKDEIREELKGFLGEEDMETLNQLVEEEYEGQFMEDEEEDMLDFVDEQEQVIENEEEKEEEVMETKVVKGVVNGKEVYYVYKEDHLFGPEEVFNLANVMLFKANHLQKMKLKAGQFNQPGQSYKGFDRDRIENTYQKNIKLIGHSNFIYWNANRITKPLKPAKDIKDSIENIELSFNSIQDEVLEKSIELKDKKSWKHYPKKDGDIKDFEEGGKYYNYRALFEVFEDYGYKVFNIYTETYYYIEDGVPKAIQWQDGNTKYLKETVLCVSWKGFGGSFGVKLPYIDASGFFSNNGSRYVGMYSLDFQQKAKILKGDYKDIELIHPYKYIAKQLRVERINYDGTEELYSPEKFDTLVRNGGMGFKVKSKIVNILRHVKEFAWQEDQGTPIIWVDKFSSDMAFEALRSNIFLNFSYEDLVKCNSTIAGMDLLTGSTAAPGKRVQLAHNWKVSLKKGGKCVLVRKQSAIDDILADHVCSYNMFQPALIKTSAKRQNASTVKATYNLVSPQQYKRHFKGSDFNEKIINSCTRTLFVAKWHIPEMLMNDEQIEFYRSYGLRPNTNDCFVMSDVCSKAFETWFRKPGEEYLGKYIPGSGAKLYGDARDKGSVTSMMVDYIPVVDYKCNNEEEVNRLVEALTQIRGDLTKYQVKGNTVTFELDLIANPSMGRDNVEAISIKSMKETINMFNGTYEISEPTKTGKLSAKQIEKERNFNHTVRVVKNDNWDDTRIVLKNVAILMEDFFVQPQHDNEYYHKERGNVSLNYHQVIDGMKCLLPSLFYGMLASIDYARIKEYMLCLGIEYVAQVNNKNKKEENELQIDKKYDSDDEIELIGEN